MFFNENRYLEVREVGNKFFEYVTHQYGPFICMFEGHPLTRQEVSSAFCVTEPVLLIEVNGIPL